MCTKGPACRSTHGSPERPAPSTLLSPREPWSLQASCTLSSPLTSSFRFPGDRLTRRTGAPRSPRAALKKTCKSAFVRTSKVRFSAVVSHTLPLPPGLWVSIAQLLLTVPTAALTRVIMALEQKRLHSKPDEDLEAQGEDLGPVGTRDPTDEEQEATSSSSQEEEVSPAGSSSPSQSPQGGSLRSLWSQFLEGSSSQQEEGPSPWVDLAHLESSFQEAVKSKVAELVRLLLHKYEVKEPVTEAEMLARVTQNYEQYFPVIFGKASEFMQMIFGVEVKEVDPASHSYVLVPALGLSCDSMLGDGHSMPKVALLIVVLGVILTQDNCAPEEVIWEALSAMGVYVGMEHTFYGEPRKLLTQDWVQENYLEYRRVPGSDPERYEFLWGSKAHAETSDEEVLDYLVRINGRGPICYPSLCEEVWGKEQEGV
ncbi:Melanoma-associated antigen 9 [Saguinus oedipus]|uniref:Melanoma-associated antigen 9 n=2 Tax=Saguinus oedipus TaxID=9490 RepID=A0ABQ9TGR4_SAGOE|nr:Melanoma-associated antigen 9 [Saguinus oedipus]KAK2083901.1 Melanoma-associated antigen 9 [Saguinus oedipus]